MQVNDILRENLQLFSCDNVNFVTFSLIGNYFKTNTLFHSSVVNFYKKNSLLRLSPTLNLCSTNYSFTNDYIFLKNYVS